MRNPERIKSFCNQLAEIWEQNFPDWRFGQLISNVYGIQEPREVFAEEDDILLAQLAEYAAKNKEKAAIMEEMADMVTHPEKYKRYPSFKALLEDVLSEED